MTVEEKKERNRKYGAICARAKAMGIMRGDVIGAIMDIDSADQRFNLLYLYKKAVGSSGENAAISYPGHGNRRKKGKRTSVI